MPKLLALCCLLLAFTLGACAINDTGNGSAPAGKAAGPAGSEIALPGPRQAGVIGR